MRWLSLLRFEVTTQLRQREHVGAVIAFLSVATLGQVIRHGTQVSSFFGYAYILSLAFRLGIGLGADRHARHDTLMANFFGPGPRLATKLAALAAREAVFAMLAFLVGLVLWGHAQPALWYVLLFSLVAGLVYPLALLFEMVSAVRAPGSFALVLAFLLLVLFARLLGTRELLELLGLSVSPGSFATLRRLALWSFTIGGGGTILLCAAWLTLNQERRLASSG